MQTSFFCGRHVNRRRTSASQCWKVTRDEGGSKAVKRSRVTRWKAGSRQKDRPQLALDQSTAAQQIRMSGASFQGKLR